MAIIVYINPFTHESSGGGGGGSSNCGGGSNIETNDCNSSETHIVSNPYGYSVSAGDVISYYDTATYSDIRCGTVVCTDAGGTATYEFSNGFSNCTDCSDYEGL